MLLKKEGRILLILLISVAALFSGEIILLWNNYIVSGITCAIAGTMLAAGGMIWGWVKESKDNKRR